MHRQTESALRVSKALNSNTQDVIQDGVHAEVRQGTGTPSFNNHLDHCFVVLKHKQQSFLMRRLDV